MEWGPGKGWGGGGQLPVKEKETVEGPNTVESIDSI